MQKLLPVFAITALFFVACQKEAKEKPLKLPTSLAAVQAAIQTDTVHSSDWSGTIHSIIVAGRSYGRTNNVSVAVPEDYVLVGGGAVVSPQFTAPGAFLTSSYPDADFTTWHTSSKDHYQTFTHTLTSYAVGIRIDGYSRAELLQHMQLVNADSYFESQPFAFVNVDSSYELIGGGARATTSGAGLLLTTTQPDQMYWVASAKDHLISSPGYLTAYAIGISKDFATANNIEVEQRRGGNVNNAGFNIHFIGTDTTWVVTSAGGFTGGDRMLASLLPTANAVYAISSDLVVSASGNSGVSMIRIRKKLPDNQKANK
ncbi:hypothetical protein [Chitinophaga rhizophila]|uniref:Uncharacterized protein n=1 Tax=Chitinophaga rhizophila TaxID=2866212 RepID=A0ABS7GE39_9BACT|nr:hypothetical protein [Chitinophaga rhizophila]MBW8684947.1 hypothetical protein [Chitinophaga rhizophila]